ncbi:hypothetical protein FCIRC_8808 [Fusarium circinatum]|uniref:Uncharacterized protein n=1 Tax=Fusarium circinatum TaxID=48490 RepID=A0A8H5WPX7_FUSCI|nr:hypothetical protein FCIRC_8808 [Fusarium circinatum]
MASQDKTSQGPSKTIEEFLQRHPQVGRGAAGQAELDRLHQDGDTFCLQLKLFDNAVLHRDYDRDSMKLIFAHVFVNEEQAMAALPGQAESFLCDCGVGREEGMDHHLHEFMRIVKPDLIVEG